MRKICLLGGVDKRAIAYPLIKVLMFMGKTLVVADDGVYRRFSDDYALRFNYQNSDFIISPLIDEGILEEVASVEDSYDSILFITTNELPLGCDKVIHCRGVEKAFSSKAVLNEAEKLDYKEVYVTSSKVDSDSNLVINPNKAVYSYLSVCEDKKEFIGTKEGALTSLLLSLFDKELNLPKKTVSGLLRRD